MILRRVIAHFRKQEWTAIGLDFLIVVVGVFVGIQVANWNEGQEDKRRGSAYVERLAIDVRKDIKNRGNLLSYYEAVNASAERTVVLLESPSPDSKELVVNAYRATEYASHYPTRSTWDEIVSSGDIGLLPKAFVDDGLTGYFTSNNADQARINILNSSYRKRVRRTIPHRIQLTIRESCGDVRDEVGNVTGFRAECSLDISDAELSKAAEALLNDPDILPDLRLHFSHISSARGDIHGSMYALEQALHALEGSH